jgi:hypothetical protein
MRKLFLFIFLSASLFISDAIYADDITQKRGYVEFTNLEAEYGEPKVLVNLNKTMLGFVSKLNVSDPETNELIKNLEGVRVHVYDIGSNEKPALDLLAKVSKDIQAKNWLPIVSVNEDDEKVRIFTKITDDVMDGLVVMVVENDSEGEAVFINIVGEIDPEQISRVTDSLNIDIDLK